MARGLAEVKKQTTASLEVVVTLFSRLQGIRQLIQGIHSVHPAIHNQFIHHNLGCLEPELCIVSISILVGSITDMQELAATGGSGGRKQPAGSPQLCGNGPGMLYHPSYSTLSLYV